MISCGIVLLRIAYSESRLTKTWYREDEYGFEMFRHSSRDRITVRYDDITSWIIVRNYDPHFETYELHVKTTDMKKVVIDLYHIRPLILLKTLFTMEKEGRFGRKENTRKHKRAMRKLHSEYLLQESSVREEMQKTGVSIPIPQFEDVDYEDLYPFLWHLLT